MTQRPDGKGEQSALIIVARDPVHVHDVAGAAAMNQHPLAVLTNGHGDRSHAAATLSRAIAGSAVEVDAPQAPRAMIAMARAGGIERKLAAALAAFEITRPSPAIGWLIGPRL